MSQVFTNLKLNYLSLHIRINATLQRRNSKLYSKSTDTVFLDNEFKISNIWTQVYFMQNYLIDGDINEKITWCSVHYVFWACSIAEFLARLFCRLIVSQNKLFLFIQRFIQLFRFSLSLLPRNSGMFNFRTIKKRKKKKKDVPRNDIPSPDNQALWTLWSENFECLYVLTENMDCFIC